MWTMQTTVETTHAPPNNPIMAHHPLTSKKRKRSTNHVPNVVAHQRPRRPPFRAAVNEVPLPSRRPAPGAEQWPRESSSLCHRLTEGLHLPSSEEDMDTEKEADEPLTVFSPTKKDKDDAYNSWQNLTESEWRRFTN